MFFKQIKYRGDNFSYVVADEDSREAVVVDPSFNIDTIILVLKDKGFNLKYVVDTHGHPDHAAGNRELKSHFNSKIVAHRLSHVGQDVSVDDRDVIRLGKTELKVIHTPGHTPDSICLLVDGKLLTGDTLFVGECGRTDLPGGSPKDMYASLRKIAKLDDKIEVYPGHDYGSSPISTVGIEKRANYTLQNRTLEEFLVFMGTP
jgi:hydroxyacylglutathione hydrolase